MMFFINWLVAYSNAQVSRIKKTLISFGWLNKDGKIVFLGLDNAGKTTLLRMLKDNRLGCHTPTVHPHSEQLTLGKVNVTAFDLGGHETARRVWRQYCGNVDAICFIVDASDRTRFQESAEELKALLSLEELYQKPVVVLGNKIDKPSAASEDELRMHLGLHVGETYGKNSPPGRCVRPVEVFMCSILKKQGYAEAFGWLAPFLQEA